MSEPAGHLPARAPDQGESVREIRSWPPAESLVVTKALVMVGTHQGVFGSPCPAGFSTEPCDLLPVANRPVLFHTLDWLEEAGVREVALVVDRRSERRVRDAVAAADDWSLTVTSLAHDVEGGLPHAVSVAADVLQGDPFVLHLGDSLARTPLRVLTGGRPLEVSDAVLFVDGTPGPGPGRVVDLARGRLASMIRGLPTVVPGPLAGIALFGAGGVEAAQAISAARDCELDMVSAAEHLSVSGGRVEARVLDGWWRFRGQPDALLDANRFVLEGMPGRQVAGALHGSNIQGKVMVHDSAIVDSTTIRGPAIVGPRVRLTDAYIGPYTSIGEDVVVEGAEIEHSIVLPGARISYLGGRLEASVIGSGAKVFRDFRLPKAFRLQVGAGAEVSLA